jgi:hypothetical protein
MTATLDLPKNQTVSRRKNPLRKNRLAFLETTTDLHLVESLVRDLAERWGITHQVNGTVSRILTRYSSSKRRVVRDAPEVLVPRVDSRAQVGPDRARDIDAALKAVGWDLRLLVETKLPLLRLNDRLKALVRSGSLAPTKALLIATAPALEQEELLEAVLGGMGVRALKSRLGKVVDKPKDKMLEQDLAFLSKEATRALGTRVMVTTTGIFIDCVDLDGVTRMLEQLGVSV